MQTKPYHELPAGKATSGFTLVELLVSLTIIGLLLAAAPAIVSAARPGAQGRAAAYALADALRGARAAAILSNDERALRIDLKAKHYGVEPGGSVAELPASVRLEFEGSSGERDANEAEIRFFPDGSSTGGAIKVITQGQSRVVINRRLTGRTSIDE